MVGSKTLSVWGIMEGIVHIMDLLGNKTACKWATPVIGTFTIGLTAYLILKLPNLILQTIRHYIWASLVHPAEGQTEDMMFVNAHAVRVSHEMPTLRATPFVPHHPPTASPPNTVCICRLSFMMATHADLLHTPASAPLHSPMDSAQQNGAYFSWSKSGLGPDQDQTNIDSPRWSQSGSQKLQQGPDHLVSSPAKMAPDQTKLPQHYKRKYPRATDHPQRA